MEGGDGRRWEVMEGDGRRRWKAMEGERELQDRRVEKAVRGEGYAVWGGRGGRQRVGEITWHAVKRKMVATKQPKMSCVQLEVSW